MNSIVAFMFFKQSLSVVGVMKCNAGKNLISSDIYTLVYRPADRLMKMKETMVASNSSIQETDN